MSDDGGQRRPIDWATPHRWISLVDTVHDNFLANMEVSFSKRTLWLVLGQLYPDVSTLNQLQYDLDNVSPNFNPKPTLICVIHLFTKFRQFQTLKTPLNRLRHTRTYCTSLRTLWMFLDVLTLKLPK